YDKLREGYLNRSRDKDFLSITDARANKLQLDWENYTVYKPKKTGIHTISPSLKELVTYIDWTPFFRTWDLHGKYPDILTDEVVGEQAVVLFDDAKKMLASIIDENWMEAKGVYGIFPANQVNDDDVTVYDENGNELVTFLTLRQQSQKTKGAPNIALSDFVCPKETGKTDYMGAFCVTTGFGVDEKATEFEKNHDDYNSIMVKALGDRFAEAFAEYLHEKVRKEFWGYASNEDLSNEALIK